MIIKAVKNILGFIVVLGLFIGVHYFHTKLKWPITVLDVFLFPLAIFWPVEMYFKIHINSKLRDSHLITWKQLLLILLVIIVFVIMGVALGLLGYYGQMNNIQHDKCGMHAYTWGLISFDLLVAALLIAYHDVYRYFYQ